MGPGLVLPISSFTKSAVSKYREEIYDAAEMLRRWPDCRNVKALTGHEYGYRVRVGDWRIMFDVTEHIRIIMIQEVKKRDEHTY